MQQLKLGVGARMAFWEEIRHLHDFGHLVGMAFEANLAYSVLIRLGRFSGNAIDEWTESEIIRVISALSETKTFDARAFETRLEQHKKLYLAVIGSVNKFAVPWAVVAAVSSVLIQIAIAFGPDVEIPTSCAVLVLALVLGGVPVGALMNIGCHGFCRTRMWWHSRRYSEVIGMFEKAPAEEIDRARNALREKREAARQRGEESD